MKVTKMSKKSLSKRIQELLTTATPKQKAQLVCKQWTENNTRSLEPLLTEDEVKALRDSLTTDKEKREYNKWIGVYNVYSELTPLFGLVYKEYQGEAEKLLGYLRVWEAYNQEENHLNTLYQELLDNGNKEAIEAFNRGVSYLTFVDAKLTRDKDGYIEIDITHLYEKIKERLKTVWSTYEAAKAIVIVTDGYTKRTHSSAFRPEPMLAAISNIKEDYSLRVAPRYSRKLLQERIDRGQRVSPDEKMRAVYPYFEEIEVNKELIDLFTERLNEMIAAYGK